uniref:C-type lectin domain-containing protein n=1 Tax=Castor canadensis TaxID=51338 RepID=A0A8C0W4M9_CASCN
PTLVHLYQTSSLLPGHLPIVASASLRLLYLLAYSGHISHIQVLGFLPFPYSSHLNKDIQAWLHPDLCLPIDRLCYRCPWDGTVFQGNCYFLSKSQQSYRSLPGSGGPTRSHQSDKEQVNKGSTWIGLSDLKHEGTWLWLDGSSPSQSFIKYQKTKEFNNTEEKDCVEFNDFKWNADRCELEKFWICRKSAASCFSK